MTLCARIPFVPGADPLDPVQDRRVPPGSMPKVGPMPPPSPTDDIVDRGQGQIAVVEVAVVHGFGFRYGNPTPIPFELAIREMPPGTSR